MKKQWKKFISFVLCIAMVLSCNAQVFAVGIDISDNGTHLDEKQSVVKSDAQVKAVEALIEAIGKVEYTDECLAKIVAAEKAYDKLTAAQKDQVENIGTLRAARNAYDALAADKVDTGNLTVADSGTIGTLKWAVYTNCLLEISGSGAVPSYSQGSSPWYNYASAITSILVRSSVTSIGKSAFYGCNNVTNITLPFVGESRDATGVSGQFGYIFGTKESSSYISGFDRDGFAPQYGYRASAHHSPYYYYYQFYTPTNLKTVTITDATQLSKAAFHKCDNITKIVLNDGITTALKISMSRITATITVLNITNWQTTSR